MQEALLLSRLDGMEAKLVDQELRLANAANEIVWLKQQISRLESIVPLLAKAAAVAVAPVNFSPRSCQEALDSGLPEYKDSGMYWIDPDGLGIGDGSIYVYCDMTTGQIIKLEVGSADNDRYITHQKSPPFTSNKMSSEKTALLNV